MLSVYVEDTEKNENILPDLMQFTVLRARGGEGRYKQLQSKSTINTQSLQGRELTQPGWGWGEEWIREDLEKMQFLICD